MFGVVSGLLIAGAGMILPNNGVLGWTLIGIGGGLFIVSSTLALADYLKPRQPQESSKDSSAGDINVKMGDRNKVKNIGHRL
ncbi:MAG: hypothetical protein Q8N51_18080 [Gammaproteobacteria bacterium]|nr:hypothetical protein [Gammaproteobacteria bacterium]